MAEDFSEDLSFGLADLPAPGSLDDPPQSLSPFERAAARQRRAVLRGRNEPSRTTQPATLASISASLVPGSAVADASGLMPDFHGGFEPSLRDNFGRGNYFTAGLQGLGVVGDAVQLVPYVGTAIGSGLKVPRAIQRAARASAGARRLENKPPIFDRNLRRMDGEVPQTDLRRGSSATPSDELARLFATEGLEDKMLNMIQNGRKLGATNWYNTEPVRQVFIKELGPDEGEKAFRKYMSYVAATSASSDVGSNVRNGSYYFGLDVREGRVPAVDDPMPRGFGHHAQHNHQIFSNKVFDGQLDPLIYQKLTSFFENLTGNYSPVTVDRHALRLPAMLAGDSNFLAPRYKKLFETTPLLHDKEALMKQFVEIPAAWRAPIAAEYAALEQFYKRLAQRADLAPAEAQAAAWVGGRDLTGVHDNGLLSFIEHFEDRVHLTADKLGISIGEVLRRFVRGEANLVSLDQQKNAVV